jgi:hypothetical protein
VVEVPRRRWLVPALSVCSTGPRDCRDNRADAAVQISSTFGSHANGFLHARCCGHCRRHRGHHHLAHRAEGTAIMTGTAFGLSGDPLSVQRDHLSGAGELEFLRERGNRVLDDVNLALVGL